MAILHKNINAEGDIHNPKWFSGANNGDVAWRNELGVLESTDELVLPAALNFVDGSAAPPTSNSGDIYVLSSGASVNAGWGTVALGDWVRYDGTNWNLITPQKSSLCYNETLDKLFSYSGSAWSEVGGGSGTDADAVHVNVPSEISGIAAKATPTSSDLLIIEDVADSNNKKKITIGDLPSSGGGGNTIYTADDTLTGNRTVDLGGNTLKLEGGQTYIDNGSFNPLVINRKASGNQGVGVDFNSYNSSNAETNFARVVQVATSNTAGSEDGGLWFRVSDGGSISTKMEINSNAIKFNDLQSVDTGLASNEMWSDNGFLRVGSAIGNGITLYETDGTLTEDRTVNIGNNKLNLLALGGSTEIKSNGVNPLVISRNLTGTQGVGVDFNAKNSSNIQHNFARVIQVATSNTAGSEDGGLWLRVSDNGNITTKVQIDVDNTEIKNKAILESTLDVYGTGTTGNSLLSLYDGQGTPVKLWDFLDNGNVNLGGDSVVDVGANTLSFNAGGLVGDVNYKFEGRTVFKSTNASASQLIFEGRDSTDTRIFGLFNNGDFVAPDFYAKENTGGGVNLSNTGRALFKGNNTASNQICFETRDSTDTRLFEVRNNGNLRTMGILGFTGTGSYTNFTIKNGLITNAS